MTHATAETLSQAIQAAFDAHPKRTKRLSYEQKWILLRLTDANEHVELLYRRGSFCALEIACDAEHEPLALALIDHGFSWKTAEHAQFNPVFSAASFSRAVLERLDAQGAPFETSSPEPSYGFPLHAAADAACEPALRFLLEKGSNPNIVCPSEDAGQATPLHTLGHRGNSHRHEPALCARALVEFGADLALVDRFGHTPLHWAYAEGAEILAEELIRLGSPWQTDLEGNWPADLAEVYCDLAEEEDRAWPRNRKNVFDPIAAKAALARLAALPARVERDALRAAIPGPGDASAAAPASSKIRL